MKIDPHSINGVKFPLWMIERSIEKKNTAKSDAARDTVSLGSGEALSNGEINRKTLEQKTSAASKPAEEKPPETPRDKKWTILFYSAADNDLEPYMLANMNQIENAVPCNDMNLIAQFDRGLEPSSGSGQWKGCRRYNLNFNKDPQIIESAVLEDMGQVNMSDPKVLQNFIEWGIKNFPAEHYMLIISDHGAGCEGAIEDFSHKGWMSLPSINKGIEAAEKNLDKKIDIIGFDACLMAQTEVGYELKNSADYLVASEEMEGAAGWPYPKILSENAMSIIKQALLSKIDLEPADMARLIVKSSSFEQKDLPTMSAIDLKKMDEVAKATDELAKEIIKSDAPSEVFIKLIKKTQAFGSFRDEYDFCRQICLSEDIKDDKLKEAAKKTMDAIFEAVILEEHSPDYPNARGLAINLPSIRVNQSKRYGEIAFAKDTKWDEALSKIQNGPGYENMLNKPDSANFPEPSNIPNINGSNKPQIF